MNTNTRTLTPPASPRAHPMLIPNGTATPDTSIPTHPPYSPTTARTHPLVLKQGDV